MNEYPLIPKERNTIARQSRAMRTRWQSAPPAAIRRPTVSGVLREWGPWICCMALLGECEDGIPLAARFYSHKDTSHFVFYGQDDAVLATLVEPIMYSLIYQAETTPKDMQFVIVTERTTEWSVADSEYCRAVASPYREDGESVISQFAGLVEQRKMGRFPLHPRFLLVLHDLGQYWDYWGDDPKRDIIPLLREGHKFGVNVIASIRYEDYNKIPQAVRKLLRQKVYGYASAEYLPNVTAFRQVAGVVSAEIAPYQAWVRSDGEWMRYTAPMME